MEGGSWANGLKDGLVVNLGCIISLWFSVRKIVVFFFVIVFANLTFGPSLLRCRDRKSVV